MPEHGYEPRHNRVGNGTLIRDPQHSRKESIHARRIRRVLLAERRVRSPIDRAYLPVESHLAPEELALQGTLSGRGHFPRPAGTSLCLRRRTLRGPTLLHGFGKLLSSFRGHAAFGLCWNR
jgi:hypothetical protein